MMKKFRKWLIDRFLPRWAYESLLDELAAANKKQEELRQTVNAGAARGGRRQTIACGRVAFGKSL